MMRPTKPLSRSELAICEVTVSMPGTVPRTRPGRVGDLPYPPPLTSRDVGHHVGVRPRATVLAAVQGVDLGDLVVAQLEVEQPDVLLDALGRRRLREHDAAALDVPAQRDLRGGPADLVGDGGDDRVVEDAALRDRRPRLGRDAVRLAVR